MRTLTGIIGVCLLLGSAWAQKKDTPAATGSQAASTPELKTQTYKGSLMDAKCAGGGEGSGAQATSAKTGGESNPSCGVSTSTTEFALRTKDDRTLLFDAVGNERAQEALKGKKKWEQSASSGKPIQAKVSAAEVAGKLTVLSIN